MSDHFAPIYTLRSQCPKHHLDTTRTFTLVKGTSPAEPFRQLELQVKKDWKEQHRCTHEILFSRIMEKDALYNTKTKKAQER